MPYIQLLSPMLIYRIAGFGYIQYSNLAVALLYYFLQNAILELSMPVALFLLIKLKIRLIRWSAGAGLGKQYPSFWRGARLRKKRKGIRKRLRNSGL